MNILFATGNNRKVTEATASCEPAGITITPIKLDIEEIQSHDPIEAAKHKSQMAFAITQQPTLVADTSWNIPALHGFPGAYMKDVAEWFTASDFLQLMKDRSDQRICFIETIIYIDHQQQEIFSKEFWGQFTNPSSTNGNSIEQVAQFNGQTIAQRRDQGKLSHDPEEFIWKDVANWLKQNHRNK
jgi:XTP/dITP diphosphohydrolase